MSIRAMKRDEVRNIGLSDEVTLNLLLSTRISFTAGIAISSYHHSDWQPRREQDIERFFNGVGRSWSWNWIPCEMVWTRNGVTHRTACAIHFMPHGDHLHGRFSFRIEGSRFQANGQIRYGHFCLHYIDSMEIRWRNPATRTNEPWWRRGNNEILNAVRILNAQAQPVPTPPIQLPPTIANPSFIQHTVLLGETWTRIRNNFGVTEQQLRAANPHITNPDRLVAGRDVLNIPTLSTQPPVASGRTIIIQSGDTLTRIANLHGVSKGCILHVNPWITNPDKIPMGRELKIPA